MSNGDTFVPLRDLIEARILANSQRIDAIESTSREQRQVDREALQIATTALEKRLDGLNEFRAQLGDQAKTFVTRELHDALASEVERRVNAAQADVNRRFDDDRLAISRLQTENSKLQGALAIARFVGFGGFLTGLGALVWIIVNSGGKPL